MSKAAAETAGRSWRTIRQEVQPRAMSRRGRRRQQLEWLKAAGVCVLVGAIAWGTYELANAWADRGPVIAQGPQAVPLGEPILITDGVLDQDWVKRTLALPPAATLMSLDLFELRDKLQASPQVRVAVVTRRFPDTLVVTLQERTPIARLQVQESADRRQMVVSQDGVVYEGLNYDRELVASLPWLDGFALRRQGSGYAPIPEMESVASLLITAQNEAAWLYKDWLVVSLARIDVHDEIVVKAQGIPEIVFSRKLDFYKQIARLDYLLELTRDRVEALPSSVNLSLGAHATMRFEDFPALQPARNGAGQGKKNTQRKL